MKKQILLILVIISWLSVMQFAIADPGDVTITITFPADILQVSLTEFLAERPNRTMIDDPTADPNDYEPGAVPKIKKYTDKQHIKNEILLWIDRECLAGALKLEKAARQPRVRRAE